MITHAALASWIDSEEYQGSDRTRGVAYDNYALDEHNRIAEARARYARDLAQLLRPGSRVLEIGCATGSLLAVLREHGHHVAGIDLSVHFAEAARARHGLDVRVGDFLHAELPAGSFDAVLAMGTASNFRALGACLERIRALLAPGGFLMFNFPDAGSRWVRWLYRGSFWMFTPSAMTFMTQSGCLRALQHAGLHVVRTAADRQQPSLRKLLQHSRMGFMIPAVRALGLGNAALPLAMPVPTVRLIIAAIAQP
jgi:SAM-dependent methyltransferase